MAIHAGPAEPYQLRFFRPDENELLEALMEMIIPADEHSPGAREAKVSLFADWMVSHAPPATQQEWRTGLQLMNDEARNTSPPEALAKAAAGEAHPDSGLHRFFIRLKQMTVDGRAKPGTTARCPSTVITRPKSGYIGICNTKVMATSRSFRAARTRSIKPRNTKLRAPGVSAVRQSVPPRASTAP